MRRKRYRDLKGRYLPNKAQRVRHMKSSISKSRGSGETKFNDQDTGQTTVANTGTVLNNTLPGLITVGTGESERIGRKITLHSVMLRGRIILPSTSTVGDTTDVCRLIMYIDKQTNGAAATVANILKSANINSFRNLDNSSRFIILHDVTYTLKAQGGAGNGTTDTYVEDVRYLRIYKTNLKLNIEYQASTGAVADLTQNNIGILAISSSGKCNIKYSTRLRYSDK